MITTTETQERSADDVLRVLSARGFRIDASRDHCLAVRDDIRLALPGRGRTLPSDFLRRLEYALDGIDIKAKRPVYAGRPPAASPAAACSSRGSHCQGATPP